MLQKLKQSEDVSGREQLPAAQSMLELPARKRWVSNMFHILMKLLGIYTLILLLGTLFLTFQHYVQYAEWQLPRYPLPLGSPYELGSLLTVVVSAWIVTSLERRPFFSLGVNWTRSSLSSFALGTVLGLFHIFIIATALIVDGRSNVLLNVNLTSRMLLTSLFTSLLVAVYEELLFRGYILQILIRGGGVVFGIVTSATLFSLFHLQAGYYSIPQLLAIGVIGVALAALTIKTRSLWIPIGFHFGWDLAAKLSPPVEAIGVLYLEPMYFLAFLVLMIVLVLLPLNSDRASRVFWARYVSR